ncbi:hypothetical protein [Levilactobacillus namurensis]|uniref:hypothetical protein n=1 Tax=Levilactobacillus namurensis TaxID=380393 RepID=UPI001D2B5D7B|nr:hypothetical protein [Levilactobacillus namurensis]HJE45121.1 hypothetical protein [Levilactobacillus namurensis]
MPQFLLILLLLMAYALLQTLIDDFRVDYPHFFAHAWITPGIFLAFSTYGILIIYGWHLWSVVVLLLLNLAVDGTIFHRRHS